MKVSIVQKLLAFETDNPEKDLSSLMPGERLSLAESIQMPFKPKGLIIWGATDQTFVERIMCGNSWEAMVDAKPIPARYFEVGRSFEDIKKLAELGELELSIPQRQVLNMTALEVGTRITLDMKGPFKNLCIWGNSVDHYGPMPTDISIVEDAANKRFTGTMSRLTLEGFQEVLTVHAPSSADCAVILASRSRVI